MPSILPLLISLELKPRMRRLRRRRPTRRPTPVNNIDHRVIAGVRFVVANTDAQWALTIFESAAYIIQD